MFAIIMQLSSCKDRITAIITACKCNYPNVRQPSGRQRFSSFSMLQAKILLIENSLSMSKGFLDHNLFHDPNVTTIHCDNPDNRAKDVWNSALLFSVYLVYKGDTVVHNVKNCQSIKVIKGSVQNCS